MVWAILFGGFLLIAIFPVPIGVGLGLTGLTLLYVVVGDATDLAVTSVWNVLSDFSLSAVPIFIFMGEIMLVSGVSNRMYSAITPFFSRVPGRLLQTNIVVSTLFGAVSGASTSTAAAVGSVAYPELARRGYDRPTIVGTLAAGGTLGLLIPPSISLLIYGSTQHVSIGRLFLAGILPGLLVSLLFMIFIAILSYRKPSILPVEDYLSVNWLRAAGQLLTLWPVGFLVFAVLGTIYLGLATPTEAAALGVATAIVLGFTWGQLTTRKLWDAFVDSTQIFVKIGVVMIGALILAQALSIIGVPFQVLSWIQSAQLSPMLVLAAVCLVYLVLGCFFDGISLLLMTLPIVFPVMTGVGFDPVWLGVVITIMIEVGMITPPVGMNLFVLTSISGNQVKLLQAAQASAPFWLILLLSVGIFTLFPEVVLFLPSRMH